MKVVQNMMLTRLLLGVAILILVFISYVSYNRIIALTKATELVNHTNVVKLKLAELHIYIKDMETGQRGFLLTRDSAFLEPYKRALVEAEEALQEVDSLTADNPPQAKNIRQLKVLLRSHIRKLNLTLEVSLFRSKEALFPLLEESKIVMDNIHTEISVMQGIEDKLLKKRSLASHYSMAVTPLYVLILFFVALVIVLLLFRNIIRNESKLMLLNEDLTERERQLSMKNLELEQTNEELSSFNYVASHDLQEPLRKIQIFSKRVLDSEVNNFSSSGKNDFDRINSAAQRMQKLIESLLNYSRVSSKQLVFLKTDLEEILEGVKSDLQELIDRKNAVIESQNLPVLNAVPVQMHQLFLNLISNAIKYAKPDMVPYIHIQAEHVEINGLVGQVNLEGAYWQITVRDNGIGFDQEYEDKIFEVFQRLHAQSEYEGTGIGLAICKKILLAHNGSIIANGEPGIGATFIFFLPDTPLEA